MDICDAYFGVACIDGSCPIANADEYNERGYDVIYNCNLCWYYKGCEDCGNIHCPKNLETCQEDENEQIS